VTAAEFERVAREQPPELLESASIAAARHRPA